MTRFKCLNIAAVCAAVVLCVSCTDFFTASWAANSKRDFSKITVSASNVNDLLRAARGDPDMSMAILNNINSAMDGASDEEKKKLREAALQAAAQATDVEGLVVSNIETLIERATAETADIEALMQDIVNSIDIDKFSHASDALTSILPGVNSDGTFSESFEATDSELMLAAVVIILGQADGDVSRYMTDWGSGKNLTDMTMGDLLPEEKVLAAIVNKLASGNGALGNGLKDLMS